MRSKIFIFYLIKAALSIAAAAACIQSHAQGMWDKEEKRMIETIDTETIAASVGFLSDSICAGRATGTRGSTEAAAWIQREFTRSGLLPFGKGYGKRVHTDNGMTGRNIIGLLPGSISMPRDRYIIIAAHYDHLGTLNGKLYPGADSNASGTVAMTTIARMFSEMRHMGKVLDSSIIFVATDAKEINLSGSNALWRMLENGSLRDPVTRRQIFPEDIALMVNIDQAGSTLSPTGRRKDYLIMLGNDSLKEAEQDLILQCNRNSGLNMDIGLSYYGSRNFTELFYEQIGDQSIFVRNRIPSVMFTSGITLNNNKTRDTATSLDMEILRKRILLIYHWVDGML